MVHKKIAQSSLTGVVFSLLLVIGIFTGMFLWLQSNANNSGVAVDPKYNDTYTKLNDAREGLDDNVQEIKDAVSGITEADNAVQVAWNGLKSLGSTLKLPIKIIDTATQTYEAVEINLDIIPDWVGTLIVIGLLAFGIFLVLAILAGGGNKL
jgi:hypothetical protein